MVCYWLLELVLKLGRESQGSGKLPTMDMASDATKGYEMSICQIHVMGVEVWPVPDIIPSSENVPLATSTC